MKKKVISIITGLIISISIVGCSSNNINSKINNNSVSSTSDTTVIQDNEYEFNKEDIMKNDINNSVYIIDTLANEDNSNIIYSPLSLNYALSMLLVGAEKDTKTEESIANYLGTKEYYKYAQEYMQYSKEKFNKENEMMGYKNKFLIANSAWLSKDFEKEFNSNYMKLLDEYFQANLEYLDFKQPVESSDRINSWCDEKTNGLIKQIIEPGSIRTDCPLILTNAVYFESAWVEKWRVYDGDEYIFTDVNNKTVEAEFIENRVSTYYENSKAVAFSANYYNGMKYIAILPKEEQFNLSDLDIYSLIQSETNKYDVDVTMPKFKIDNEINIKSLLNNSDLDIIFSTDAQFSNIVSVDTHVDDIIQKAVIELDENGTKAAAVTAVMMKTNSLPEPKELKEIIFDRPFAFMIVDDSNQIIFIGRVNTL